MPDRSSEAHEAVLVVVDDDPLVHELVRHIVAELRALRVEAFDDAAVALAWLRAHDPDVVITDYQMPGLSGTELAGALRSRRAGLPFVLMSGYIGPMMTERARTAGVMEILKKPVQSRDLAAALALTDESLRAVLHAVQLDVPDVDLETRATGGIEFARDAIEEFSGRVKFAPRPNVGDAYTEDIVEKVVAPFGNNPRPHYPARLQADEVEGSFVVRFVVDSLGRVDSKTLQFPTTTHKLFMKSIRDALLRSRYLPAELAGRHVPQLVQQRFSFTLERIR